MNYFLCAFIFKEYLQQDNPLTMTTRNIFIAYCTPGIIAAIEIEKKYQSPWADGPVFNLYQLNSVRGTPQLRPADIPPAGMNAEMLKRKRHVIRGRVSNSAKDGSCKGLRNVSHVPCRVAGHHPGLCAPFFFYSGDGPKLLGSFREPVEFVERWAQVVDSSMFSPRAFSFSPCSMYW